MNILSEVVTEAFGVALVGYVASLALAQGSAKQFKYSVDDNQELLAHGLSNVIPSFFFCIPSAAAMGRTALLYSTGAKTQVACLISCILILVVIYAIGPMLYWLPMCVLASIIVVGLKGMLMQFRDLKKYWNVDKIDWSIWVSTYVFTVCFAANVGLLYGVVCTIVIVIFPNYCDIYCSTLSIDVKIVSVNNPLVFLNAKKFHHDLIRIIQKDSASSQPHDDLNKCEQNTLLNPVSNGNCELSLQPCLNERCALILDCSGLTFFDYTGVSVLLQIYMDFKNRSIDVLLAHCKASLVKAMQYSGNLGSENPIFFESVSSAIGAIHLHRQRFLSRVSSHGVRGKVFSWIRTS
uniref:STAS domain-containing protein n=1 Tax=Chelydra serpentina TaxID=8475 RepID=A0A8C3S0R1_CHESE